MRQTETGRSSYGFNIDRMPAELKKNPAAPHGAVILPDVPAPPKTASFPGPHNLSADFTYMYHLLPFFCRT